MDLTYATIVVLASMTLVLAGMTGYLYLQQTRILQHIQSLSLVVESIMTPPAEPEPPVNEAPPPVEAEEEDEEDDRVSVEHVDAPPDTAPQVVQEPDIDDLQTKTAQQLRDLLTQKGIPFGKRDSKTTLLELLKATA